MQSAGRGRNVLIAASLSIAGLVSLVGALACAVLVAEHDMSIGKWFIHYIVYALPGAVLGGVALLVLVLATCPRGVRRGLTGVALVGLAPAVVGLGWLLLR